MMAGGINALIPSAMQLQLKAVPIQKHLVLNISDAYTLGMHTVIAKRAVFLYGLLCDGDNLCLPVRKIDGRNDAIVF